MKSFYQILWIMACILLLNPGALVWSQEKPHQVLKPIDVFQLETASDPQISPNGQKIVYVRNFMDIMTDKQMSNLWIINFDGTDHRPLTTGNENHNSPRWSPDGERLLYVSNTNDSAQIYVRWMDTGQTAKLTNLTQSPSGLTWSDDGKWVAFSMTVPKKSKPWVDMPTKPDKAAWAPPAKVIDKLLYRSDGKGYLKDGFKHLFVLPADGGTPRQITSEDFDHAGPASWTPDGKALIFSANRHPNHQYDPQNSEVYQVDIADGSITALTNRPGPDQNPVVSPNGNKIAYLGYDDKLQGYQVTHLYIMDSDGKNKQPLTRQFDRDIQNPTWNANNRGLFFQYDEEGNTKIGYVNLDGEVRTLADNLGGVSLGRPYGGGSFSVSQTGRFAYTHSRPDHPSDVAVGRNRSNIKKITDLNDDLFSFKKLATVEEITYESSYDGRQIQGWIAKPPDFNPTQKYPLILEIHGGPFANYGDRFTAEIQLFAAAGYVVLYTNPRGSTSYGQEFGNLIHHNYPSEDYDDLMSGVDAVIKKGYIDTDNLFVTGGSGGGVLTSWIVGKTDRFAAAVVAKPVINWYSFVLTADSYNFFYKYWFPGPPWEHPEHYMNRSPLSLVGNVTTPTMLLTGEADYRTPISESEQFFQALKLRQVDTVMVRIPDASHGIASQPSNLIAKVLHILKWFETHKLGTQ